MLPSRFWELATGVALCAVHRQGWCLPRSPWQALACVAASAVVLAAALASTDSGGFPMPRAVLPVFGAVLAICAATAVAANSQAGLARYHFVELPTQRRFSSGAMRRLGGLDSAGPPWRPSVLCAWAWWRRGQC
jgi:peptidoglycan/LPS O-acetylase OafA/YrhL